MKTTETRNTPPKEEIDHTFVGIDIAKDALVVHILPTNTQLTVPNSPKGFRQLLQRFKDNPSKQILCEATGGYQNEFVRQLIKTNLPIHTANPTRIKHYIASLGTKAKTDKSDARYITMDALERQPEPMKNRGETHRTLKECLGTRR